MCREILGDNRGDESSQDRKDAIDPGGGTRFTNDQVFQWPRNSIKNKGVVTWEVPIQPNGLIPQPFIGQLGALKQAMEDS